MSSDTFRVSWTESAARDLEDLIAYIAEESPINARRLFKRIRKRAMSLATAPARGRIPPELVPYGLKSFRELIIRPYRLVYRIEGKRVFVLAVFDVRRDLEDLLLECMLRG